MPKFMVTEPAAQAGFGTVERFLTADTEGGRDGAGVDEEALRQAYEAVRLGHAPPLVGGAALLQRVAAETRLLSTGCRPIDDMLDGGLPEGQVIEVFGDSGAGKTQLCMMACARAAARGERSLYLDTSNAFSGMRLAAMLRAQGAIQAELGAAVERVAVARVYTAHAALAALDDVIRGYNSSEPPPQRLSMVVLDSIGAVMAPVVGGGGPALQGHAVLAAAAALLKQVARKLHVPVIVTNHMVGGGGGGWKGRGGGGGGGGGGGEWEKRPALGESWANQCQTRVQLWLPQQEGGPWAASVRASPLVAPGATAAQFWIAAAGLAAQPPAGGAAAAQQGQGEGQQGPDGGGAPPAPRQRIQ